MSSYQRYILLRVSLIPVTLILIFLVNFLIIMTVPGGPVDQLLAGQMIGGEAGSLAERVTQFGNNQDAGVADLSQAQEPQFNTERTGLAQDQIDDLRERYGLDQPLHRMFITSLWAYLRFDFGDSLIYSRPVTTLIIERIPVMLGLGVITYLGGLLIGFTFGIMKAYRQDTLFDRGSTLFFIALDAIPNLVLAIGLLTLFAAGGLFFQPDGLIPLGGLVSDNFEELSWWGKIKDYLWHLIAPAIVLLVGSYASQTNFLRNAYADQLSQTYVMTARAKGLSENQVFWRHVFRNGGILIIPGIPIGLIGILFTGSVIVEKIFNIEGLGLLGLDALSQRDFRVLLGTTWIFSLFGLVLNLLSDLMLPWIDPRISFASLARR